MKSFAFIANHITIKEIRGTWPVFRVLPVPKVSLLKKIKSLKNREVSGFLIALPPAGNENSALEKIVACGHLAERLGAKIAGLNGDAASAADKNFHFIHKNLKIPLTTGNALTAWTIIEALYRLAKINKIDLKNAHLAITGAETPLKKLCAAKLAEYSGNILIVADNQEVAPAQDFIVNTDSCKITLSGGEIIQAGRLKIPNSKKIIPAALAETILLALEGKFTDYSLGENINPDKVEEIADLAARHGFEVWVPQAPVL